MPFLSIMKNQNYGLIYTLEGVLECIGTTVGVIHDDTFDQWPKIIICIEYQLLYLN